jgi:hypothetical protein
VMGTLRGKRVMKQWTAVACNGAVGRSSMRSSVVRKPIHLLALLADTHQSRASRTHGEFQAEADSNLFSGTCHHFTQSR